MAPRIFTVGHSNLSADDFFALLRPSAIRTLADVRAFPASRRHPQFAREALASASAAHGIAYHWMRQLGGRRRARSGSPHVAWEVEAFRAYADYADTAEFGQALAELEGLATASPTAFLCAEALWWRCHRRLIADHLLVRGWDVRHIGGGGRVTPHVLPEFARVVDGRIVYDRGATPALPLGTLRPPPRSG